MTARRVLADVTPLRRDRDFRLLWVGGLISTIGRQVTVVVLPYQLYVLTGSPLSIGLLALVQLVPILTCALGGGAVADAVDRRRLLFVTQALLMTCSLAFFLLALLPNPPVVLIYAVAFVAAGVGAVDQPARSSATPRLVPRDRLPAAIALGQLSFQASSVIGPAIGGVLLATVGVSAGYLVDAVTYLAALAAVVAIRPIPPLAGAVRPGLAAVVEGLRFAVRRRAILACEIVDLNAMVFGMPTALFPILALDVFRVGPAGVGLLTAAPAAGALVGAVLTGALERIRYTGRAILVSVAIWGLAITAFGLATFSLPLALLFLAIAGAADVMSAILRSSVVQMITPDELRGRVSAIHIVVVTSGPRLGDAEASLVATLAGAQISVVSGGLLSLLGLALTARALPELAAFDMHEAVRAGEKIDRGARAP